MVRTIFYILAICGAAAYAGALATIGLGFGSYWKSLPPAEFMIWFGANFSSVSKVIPVVVLPTLLGLAGSFWLDRRLPVPRRLWLLACACIVGVFIVTGIFQFPANSAFAAASVPLNQVGAALDKWLFWHGVRTILALAAATFAVLASESRALRDRLENHG